MSHNDLLNVQGVSSKHLLLGFRSKFTLLVEFIQRRALKSTLKFPLKEKDDYVFSFFVRIFLALAGSMIYTTR